MNFNLFKQAVAKQFATMQADALFTVYVSGDELWGTCWRCSPLCN